MVKADRAEMRTYRSDILRRFVFRTSDIVLRDLLWLLLVFFVLLKLRPLADISLLLLHGQGSKPVQHIRRYHAYESDHELT